MLSIRALLIVSITGFLAIIAATWLIMLAYADLNAGSTQAKLDQWHKNRSTLDVTEWETTHDALHEALRIRPNNPEYLELMARLYLWKAYQSGEDTSAARHARQQALQYFQQALKVSPSRPQLWAGVVESKQALGQYDESMQQAIRVAAEYGPWLPGVQRVIMRAGTESWQYLAPETRESVLQILEYALGVQPEEVIKLAIQHDFGRSLLPLIYQDEALMEFYKKELAKKKRS